MILEKRDQRETTARIRGKTYEKSKAACLRLSFGASIRTSSHSFSASRKPSAARPLPAPKHSTALRHLQRSKHALQVVLSLQATIARSSYACQSVVEVEVEVDVGTRRGLQKEGESEAGRVTATYLVGDEQPEERWSAMEEINGEGGAHLGDGGSQERRGQCAIPENIAFSSLLSSFRADAEWKDTRPEDPRSA
ncbi:hypothetical protein B0H13DRAFT_2279333 [Mycena leptocephala]|nr:hypothetical protein B0H13DRAFT_2279333 [Mycena leptocephala]